MRGVEWAELITMYTDDSKNGGRRWSKMMRMATTYSQFVILQLEAHRVDRWLSSLPTALQFDAAISIDMPIGKPPL